MEFNKIFSAGTITKHPKIVMDGFNLPSLLKSEGFSILAKGLLGSGSLGVPSTRAHEPIMELRPTIKKYNIQFKKTIRMASYEKQKNIFTNAMHYQGVILNDSMLQNNGIMNTNTWANIHIGHNGDIGSQHCCWMNGCGWMNENISNNSAQYIIIG